METPKRKKRFGRMIWETEAMNTLRVEHCMCLHCANMKPGKSDHCKIAQQFYEICLAYGNSLIMTQCDSWKSTGEE